jgi:hypothetical protein
MRCTCSIQCLSTCSQDMWYTYRCAMKYIYWHLGLAHIHNILDTLRHLYNMDNCLDNNLPCNQNTVQIQYSN